MLVHNFLFINCSITLPQSAARSLSEASRLHLDALCQTKSCQGLDHQTFFAGLNLRVNVHRDCIRQASFENYCTSQIVKWTSGTREIIHLLALFKLNRLAARSQECSIVRSIARLLDRSIARSLDRSLKRPIARSIERSIARWLG